MTLKICYLNNPTCESTYVIQQADREEIAVPLSTHLHRIRGDIDSFDLAKLFANDSRGRPLPENLQGLANLLGEETDFYRCTIISSSTIDREGKSSVTCEVQIHQESKETYRPRVKAA